MSAILACPMGGKPQIHQNRNGNANNYARSKSHKTEYECNNDNDIKLGVKFLILANVSPAALDAFGFNGGSGLRIGLAAIRTGNGILGDFLTAFSTVNHGQTDAFMSSPDCQKPGVPSPAYRLDAERVKRVRLGDARGLGNSSARSRSGARLGNARGKGNMVFDFSARLGDQYNYLFWLTRFDARASASVDCRAVTATVVSLHRSIMARLQ